MLSSRFVLRVEAIASGCFRRGWGNLELYVLRSKIGMACGEAYLAEYFAGANPISGCCAPAVVPTEPSHVRASILIK